MKFEKYFIIMFFVFSLIGCGEEQDDKEIKQVKSSIMLNETNIEIQCGIIAK